MRRMQFWGDTLINYIQQNPPLCIELVMLSAAIVLLGFWGVTLDWPYMVLSLSYAVGSSCSCLVRGAIAPSPTFRLPQLTAILLLVVSFFSFADLLGYL
ncbi:hypothetical protein [Laspinema palackyanum]|uniref:hypothetical protein n=1 Tax=Laspinema palackyanum TaxID=3231601 RepID=UPI00345CC204|nr:hypothetical protein [Laspinema sp. D2c]